MNRQLILLLNISTNEQTADIITKALNVANLNSTIYLSFVIVGGC